MNEVDPVYNNREVFKSRLNQLSDWSQEISIKDYIDALAKKKDLTQKINKMNMYESYIQQKLDAWDLATDEAQRHLVVDSVRKQSFQGIE